MSFRTVPLMDADSNDFTLSCSCGITVRHRHGCDVLPPRDLGSRDAETQGEINAEGWTTYAPMTDEELAEAQRVDVDVEEAILSRFHEAELKTTAVTCSCGQTVLHRQSCGLLSLGWTDEPA